MPTECKSEKKDFNQNDTSWKKIIRPILTIVIRRNIIAKIQLWTWQPRDLIWVGHFIFVLFFARFSAKSLHLLRSFTQAFLRFLNYKNP